MKWERWKRILLVMAVLVWPLLCSFRFPVPAQFPVIIREEVALPTTPPEDSLQENTEEEIFQAVPPEEESDGEEQAEPEASAREEDSRQKPWSSLALKGLEGELTTGETLLCGLVIALGVTAIGILGGRK